MKRKPKTIIPKPETETIIPAEDTLIGKNDAGNDIYERKDGKRYAMRYNRPDFGGDLAVLDGN